MEENVGVQQSKRTATPQGTNTVALTTSKQESSSFSDIDLK